MMDSGAADRIVRSFLRVLGEKRASFALLGSSFVLSIPVFFDTVFYLLVPLARSLWTRTRKNYVLYITAIVAGAATTHTLVPPTPGPLFAADRFGIDMGLMIVIGILVGLPTGIVALLVCGVINRLMTVPMRPYVGQTETEPLPDEQLPPLWASLLPVVLPVLLISAHTVAKAVAGSNNTGGLAQGITAVTAILGNPNLALLVSAAVAMGLVVWRRGLSLKELTTRVDDALLSGGIVILITASGGALGAMLRVAGIQEAVAGLIGTGGNVVGVVILLLAFLVAGVIKFAQGSSTVSIITTASMFAAMGITPEMLGCNPVYLATTICSGSLVGDWLNDSGFWVVARMSGLTETETLKTFTVITGVVGVTGFGVTLILSRLMPLL
jgi:GntP family gluconate:H+ symporter